MLDKYKPRLRTHMLVQEDALLHVEIMKSLVEKFFGWMWRWLRCFGEVIGGFGEVLW